MAAYVKPIEVLLLDCTREIRWEFDQIRSQISAAEIHRLADNLLCQDSLEWPTALVELQKGKSLNRLLDHLNLRVKVYEFSPKEHITLKGPFPTLSLRPLKAAVDEYRSALRAVRCIEFLGNKAWSSSFKSVSKIILPFQVDIASLALGTLGLSAKQQMKMALRDLSERIKGCIFNFLYDWENLVTQQICEQILVLKQDIDLQITEIAV